MWGLSEVGRSADCTPASGRRCAASARVELFLLYGDRKPHKCRSQGLPRPTAPALQANALFRKNGVQQRRAWVQTLVIVALPIVFCILLAVLQRLLNKALDTPENRVSG